MSETGPSPLDIAIVGAGFCGVALSRALALHSPAGTRVALIGTQDDFGRGLAYAHARGEHALNVRAKDMGIDPANLGGFADWLKLAATARDGFAPRLAYGDYIGAELNTALAENASGFSLERIASRVIGIERKGDGYALQLDNGTSLATRKLVLATGTLPATPLAQADAALRASAHCIENPWVPGALESIPADADVLIVGTGLTFADIAATLHVRGHRGNLLALSRHGLQPQAQPVSPLPPFALPDTLLAAWNEGNLKRVLHELHRAARSAPDWRAVIDALRPNLHLFWLKLDATQRGCFLRHLASYWDVHRHRLAPETFARLDALRTTGQLRITAARLISASLMDGRITATLAPRHACARHTEHADVLVRATGLVLDLRRTQQEPFAQLIKAGAITPDPQGLGLKTDAEGRVLDAGNVPAQHLSVLGPLQRAQFWEMTAVPELRVAAMRLGQRLAAELRG